MDRFWQVYYNIVKTPSDKRKYVLSDVAVDPILTDILEAAATFDRQGLDYYGAVTTNPYWVTPVDGQTLQSCATVKIKVHTGLYM